MADQAVVESVPEPTRVLTEPRDVVEVAMTAIDTLLNMSIWVLTILAFGLAVLAIVGWWQIHRIVKIKAERIANKKVDDYISSERFTAEIDRKISEAVETRWQNTIILREMQVPPRGDADQNQPFPEEPEKKT